MHTHRTLDFADFKCINNLVVAANLTKVALQ